MIYDDLLDDSDELHMNALQQTNIFVMNCGHCLPDFWINDEEQAAQMDFYINLVAFDKVMKQRNVTGFALNRAARRRAIKFFSEEIDTPDFKFHGVMAVQGFLQYRLQAAFLRTVNQEVYYQQLMVHQVILASDATARNYHTMN